VPHFGHPIEKQAFDGVGF
jgi:manganese-transporting P-type ATPase